MHFDVARKSLSSPASSLQRLTLSALVLALAGSATVRAQPVLEYRFDNPLSFEEGSAVRNVQGEGNAGFPQGGYSQVRGALGNAIDFNGTTGVMPIIDSEWLTFPDGITLEAFVRRDTNTTEDAVISKWYGGDQFLLTMLAGGSGRLRFMVRGANNVTAILDYNIPDTVYLGEWIHVGATYDGAGSLNLYWNGALVASQAAAISGLANGSRPIRVGDANNTWSRFDGAIDEVKLWHGVRPASHFARPLKPKVLVVTYQSVLPYPDRHDPILLSLNLLDDVSAASRYAQFEIVRQIDHGYLPPRVETGDFNYALLFDTYDLCADLREGRIHEVWVWAGPEGGLKEFATNGPWREAYGVGVGIPDCGTQVTVMGFNYEREIEEAGESINHRLETLLPFYWTLALWNRFDGQRWRYEYEIGAPQPPVETVGAHCGNAHFPPNADRHYEFTSADEVLSNCATWRADGSGVFQRIHCATWGCAQHGFNIWWLSNMPGPLNSHGAGGTRLKNWWTVLVQ